MDKCNIPIEYCGDYSRGVKCPIHYMCLDCGNQHSEPFARVWENILK